MVVYRYMSLDELGMIINGKAEFAGGRYFGSNPSNNHKYKKDVRYLHFFKNLKDLPLIQQIRVDLDEKCLCKFDIPFIKLIRGLGSGLYFDDRTHGYDDVFKSIREYAIESKKITAEYLVDYIEDFDGNLTPKEAEDAFDSKEKNLE